MIDYLSPFEQLYQLNSEAYAKLDELSRPPIACLKSRLANHAKPHIKPQSLERTRIRLLIMPIIYYLQDQLIENGFRQTKKQIDLLIQLIESQESINLSLLHQIYLIEILEFFANPPEPITELPTHFIQEELPRCLTKISTKIEKRRARLNHV
ncbi:hypothetical protein [Beggiatoa alba]|uniref:hypothetical protein n=1 Tax=Beggiatoa alba TaxID=1022 RepID=UPI00058BAF02|nr:hypothetical protein [Beggiatoa alba]